MEKFSREKLYFHPSDDDDQLFYYFSLCDSETLVISLGASVQVVFSLNQCTHAMFIMKSWEILLQQQYFRSSRISLSMLGASERQSSSYDNNPCNLSSQFRIHKKLFPTHSSNELDFRFETIKKKLLSLPPEKFNFSHKLRIITRACLLLWLFHPSFLLAESLWNAWILGMRERERRLINIKNGFMRPRRNIYFPTRYLCLPSLCTHKGETCIWKIFFLRLLRIEHENVEVKVDKFSVWKDFHSRKGLT